ALAGRVADDLPPAVLGDAGRLRQVLLNLVGNAIKFTSAGEVVVSVSSAACGLAETEGTAKPQAAECALHFEVRDTGIGIPPDQQVRSLLLQRGGHQVEVAANGRLALEALERGPFDLVLMDLQMPEMDGLRATRLLRAREKATGGHVPVVAVTANALEGERE